MSEIWQEVLNGIMATSLLEFAAVITGLLSVWFCRKANIWVYPTGIISVLIYVYICFNFKLYADAGINAFYFVMSVYGWINWVKIDNGETVSIRFNTKKMNILGVVGVFLFYGVVFGLLFLFKQDDKAYMNSYLPYVDALTTSVFIIAMWFQALKRVETWVYWIIGDVISIPLYFTKGLMFTSFQYFVFLALAISGYIAWRKNAVDA